MGLFFFEFLTLSKSMIADMSSFLSYKSGSLRAAIRESTDLSNKLLFFLSESCTEVLLANS